MIEPNLGGGPVLSFSGFLPRIYVFLTALHMEYYFRFSWTISEHR